MKSSKCAGNLASFFAFGLMVFGANVVRAQTAPIPPAVPQAENPAEPKDRAPAEGKPASDKKPTADRPAPKPKVTLPKDVVQASNDLKSEAVCKKCYGKGTVITSVPVGRDKFGSTMSQQVNRDVTVTCGTCDGHKVSKQDAMPRIRATLVKALSTVDISHSEWTKQFERIKGNIKAAARISMDGWRVRLAESKRDLNGGVIKAGEPFMIVGTIMEDSVVDGVRTVTIRIDDDSRLYIVNPRIVDALTDQQVLVGGVLERSEGTNRFARNGFVVSGQ